MRSLHIFIPKSHLEPREFLISSAKRLLQQYLPKADSCSAANSIAIRSPRQQAGRIAASPSTDNLRLPLEHLARRADGLTRADIADRFEDTYAKFPILKEKRRDKAGDLSGGQQKMVEFAKAYLVRPRLCLVDEPSIGLAPKVAEEVYQWIGLFASEQTAILLVDHNVRRVVKMSTYIYVLSLGEITAQGGPEAFAGDLHEQVKAWLGINF
jgi:branched-chain amino acid transport system ATP-binding protein